MKVQDLFEMPEAKRSELPPKYPVARPFFSEMSLKRNHEFIHKGKSHDGKEYWVSIKKDEHSAALGFPGKRADGTFGMDVVALVEFKSPLISSFEDIKVGPNVKQVDQVHVSPVFQQQGWGMNLYAGLASAGYVVISDNTQYFGGIALWKRIAKETMHNQYKVYVIDQGKVRVDSDDNPIFYDGNNIVESELWSDNRDLRYTLFVLKSN